ncbi:MAG: ribosome maturation factor RimM [Fastidiosipilaceae bacterium]|nr:16S rRNA processing protein RimM [Clostridiaceae bacterium]
MTNKADKFIQLSKQSEAAADHGIDDLFEVGVIVGAHGIRGDVTTKNLSDVPGRLRHLKQAFLLSPQRDRMHRVSLNTRPHKGQWIVHIEGIEDRDSAIAHKGWLLAITRAQAEPLPRGYIFVRDLIGLQVIDDQLGLIGKIKDVLTDREQNVYVVDREGKPDVLIPVVKAFIKSIEIADGMIKVSLPDGLLDVYDG